MTNSFIRSYIIPALAVFAFIWVFSRPLSSLGLYVYNFTGAHLSSLFTNIEQTKEDASDLLVAQEKAQSLEEQNGKLLLENTKLKSQLVDMPKLRAQLDYQKEFKYSSIPAQVIGRSPDTWHKQIIINKGSNAGVKIGKGVITEKGIIGQVLKVTPFSSIVQLVYNSNFKMGVKVEPLNVYGVLVGSYPGLAKIEFIPVDTQIKLGDKVYSSGVCLDDNNCAYPANFPVGVVEKVTRDPDVVDLLVSVKFAEDLTSIREVFVLE